MKSSACGHCSRSGTQLALRDRVVAAHQSTITEYQHSLAVRQSTIAEQEQTITQHEAAITTLTKQRDEYYLEKLRLEVRLAKALKQAYGPRADRIGDPGQLLLDFGDKLDALPINANDLPAESDEGMPRQRAASRRLRTRGRRDISQLAHLPMIEQTYELTGELCQCPRCQNERERIGEAISYTIEYLPAARDQPAGVSHATPGQPPRHAHQPHRRLAAGSQEDHVGESAHRTVPLVILIARPPRGPSAVHSTDTHVVQVSRRSWASFGSRLC